jgi:hypothetical protein
MHGRTPTWSNAYLDRTDKRRAREYTARRSQADGQRAAHRCVVLVSLRLLSPSRSQQWARQRRSAAPTRHQMITSNPTPMALTRLEGVGDDSTRLQRVATTPPPSPRAAKNDRPATTTHLARCCGQTGTAVSKTTIAGRDEVGSVPGAEGREGKGSARPLSGGSQ